MCVCVCVRERERERESVYAPHCCALTCSARGECHVHRPRVYQRPCGSRRTRQSWCLASFVRVHASYASSLSVLCFSCACVSPQHVRVSTTHLYRHLHLDRRSVRRRKAGVTLINALARKYNIRVRVLPTATGKNSSPCLVWCVARLPTLRMLDAPSCVWG